MTRSTLRSPTVTRLPSLATCCMLAACHGDPQPPGDDGTSSGDGTTDTSGDAGATGSTSGDDGTSGGDADTGSSSDDTSDGSGSGTTGGATTTDTTTSDANACPAATHLCATIAPAGWQGPVAVQDFGGTGPVPSCEGDYPEPSLDAVGEVDYEQGDCECDCGAPMDTACSELDVSEVAGDCKTITPATTITVGDGECASLGTPGNTRFLSSVPELTGTCTGTMTENIPDVGWSGRTIGCAGEPLDAECDADQRCLPQPTAPFGPNLCIHREGDELCPPGPYTERFVRHGDFTDTRECDTCDCELAGTCEGSIDFLAGQCGLGATLLGTWAPGECTDPLNGAGFVDVEIMPSAQCDGSWGGSTNGTVTPESAVTICCVP